jgi:hypothetical protein
MKEATREQNQAHHDSLWAILKPFGFTETGTLCKFTYGYQALYFDFSAHTANPHILMKTISDRMVTKGRVDQKEETQIVLKDIFGLTK